MICRFRRPRSGVLAYATLTSHGSRGSDTRLIEAFASEAAFDVWLHANHARETEVWLPIYALTGGKR
jgi:hypothetical protein